MKFKSFQLERSEEKRRIEKECDEEGSEKKAKKYVEELFSAKFIV